MRNPNFQNLARYSNIISKQNSAIKKIVDMTGPLDMKIPCWASINEAALYSVIGQMLSKKAAFSIINRLLSDYGEPERILLWARSNYSKCGPIRGVSQRKRKALASWYNFIVNRNDIQDKWAVNSSSDIRSDIKEIWGFGDWAADMMLIFHFGRLDVWPQNDLGIKSASERIFGAPLKVSFLKKIAGYESVLALHLWKMIDDKVI